MRTLFTILSFLLIGNFGQLSSLSAEESLAPPIQELIAENDALEMSIGSDEMNTSIRGSFIRMIISLVGILFLFFLTFWLLKKMSRTRYHQMNHHGAIKLIESRPISQKSMLYLVEIEGKRVLLAESQAEVRRLHTIDND